MKDLVPILPDYEEKVGNMKSRVTQVRDAEDAHYSHYMAKTLSLSHAQREENRKIAEIRKKRYGFDPTAQQPSTQAILDRPKEKDLEHFLRPLVDCQIRGKDGEIDVAERKLTVEEISHVEALRRRPKNSTGQSEKSAVNEVRKEASINAFNCSPGISTENLTTEEKYRLNQSKSHENKPIVNINTKENPKKSKGKLKWMGWFWKWIEND